MGGELLHENFTETNLVWTWVGSAEEGYEFKKVYINHAVAGDTDSIMMSLEGVIPADTPIDDVVEVADGIAQLTNDTFPDWVQFAFNAPEERKDAVQTDREIVSDKSLFLSKKRYILHVVNDEGKPVDKLKIMGVELKKSDTPAYVKTMLSSLVDLILDGKTIEDAHEEIHKLKRDYQDQPLRDIARPMSVKKMKEYVDRYKETGSDKGFPYNVRAAMFYNSLCSRSDKKIVPGDKIGILYIKHPKSKYIAFPIDINQFPSFMDDIIVDYDTQWEKAYKKIVSYMKSMEWDLESRKKEVRKGLFGF